MTEEDFQILLMRAEANGAVIPGSETKAATTKPSKYHNVRKEVDGIRFDSTKEARRYIELKVMQQVGEISGLGLQPEFILQPSQNGIRAIKYRADFDYMVNGRRVVEDVKGLRTAAYRIKAKMFRVKFPEMDFREL